MEHMPTVAREIPSRTDGLRLALEQGGGVAALARGLGISQPSVSAWRRIPAERVLDIEALTGVERNLLRPDLYSRVRESSHPPNEGGSEEISAPAITPLLDEIDSARAQEYSLLAALITRAPSQDLLDRLAAITADASPLGLAHAALATAARTTAKDAIAREFFNLFVGVGRGDVLPYASFYRTGFLHGRPLAQVRADLQRLGVARAADVFEPEDHLGTLLEVMAGLIRGELGPDEAQARDAIAADFFRQHIAPWGVAPFIDIAASPSVQFYRAVAGVGRLWLEIEQEAFALPA